MHVIYSRNNKKSTHKSCAYFGIYLPHCVRTLDICDNNTGDRWTSFIRRERNFFLHKMELFAPLLATPSWFSFSIYVSHIVREIKWTSRTIHAHNGRVKHGVNQRRCRPSSKLPHFCGTHIRGSVTRAHFCECRCARWSKVGQSMARSMPHEIPQWCNIGSFNYHKSRNPPAMCPSISLSLFLSFYALSAVLVTRIHRNKGYNAMKDTTNQHANLQSTLNSGVGQSYPSFPLFVCLSSSFSSPYPFILSPSLFTSVTAIHPSTQFRAYWRCPSSPPLRKM